MNDLIIIGGGPAGVAAGVYAARKRLKTVLIAEEVGGQSSVSEGIENWIGTPRIHGTELAKLFKAHLESVRNDGLELAFQERVVSLAKADDGSFMVTTKSGKQFASLAVLVVSGAGRRKLEVPGAEKFENKGVTYCASCDGPLFADMDVVVVGGGNAGFETALQLLAYAKSVAIIHRHQELKADPITVEKAAAHQNIRIIRHAEPVEVVGDQFVTGLRYLNKDTGIVEELPVSGVFVEAGVLPNTDFVDGVVELDAVKRIRVNPANQRAYLVKQTLATAPDAKRGESDEGNVLMGTATEAQGPRNEADEAGGGVWAAGDCTDELYHQNNIAAGDGVKALEDIYLWVKKR